jgi:RimJ/RimL family protein N-acetyltransferase
MLDTIEYEHNLVYFSKRPGMIELNPSEYPSVLPLLENSKQQVIPFAICEGYNPGRIFVDQKDNPQIVLIWSTVGYYFLFGDPSSIGDLQSISQTLTNIFIPSSQAMGETGFILIPSSASWKSIMPTLLPSRKVIEIKRTHFYFDLDAFKHNRNLHTQIPKGFKIQTIDETIAQKIGVKASWASIEDFLTNGIGFALLKDNEIACTCFSVFSSSKKVEIDVHTNEKFQRKGLAKLICSVFIEKCIELNKIPNWECFWDNEPSVNLAEKLGFVPQDAYPVFYWEEETSKTHN